jgi:hypothetical protein
MSASKKTCDVFISHSIADLALAKQVADSVEAAGLTAFRADAVLRSHQDDSNAIWEALAESRAVIVIFSPRPVPDAMGLVEIGAAAAWAKPVFVLVNGPSVTELPSWLAGYPVFPMSRFEEAIRAVRSAFAPLDERDHAVLARVYSTLGVSADELSQSPRGLRDLTTQFNKASRKRVSGERLLSEILRMRKRGELPRLQVAKTQPRQTLKQNRLQAPKVKPSPLLKRARLVTRKSGSG